MRTLWFEFVLSLRRLWRRPTQAGLMLATFTVSITLTLLSWSLFHTIFLQNPEFDPHGTLYRVTQTGGPMAKERQITSSREDIAAWHEQQTVFADFAPMRLYESVFVNTENGQERLLSANVSAEAFRMAGGNATQIQRRLGRSVVLPESLSRADAVAVAKRHFLAATTAQLKRIAGLALLTIGYLSTIANLRKRVDFLTRRQILATEAELIC